MLRPISTGSKLSGFNHSGANRPGLLHTFVDVKDARPLQGSSLHYSAAAAIARVAEPAGSADSRATEHGSALGARISPLIKRCA